MENFTNARIKVVGVGGGGGNAIAHMITEQIDGAEFYCLNTDTQALQKVRCEEANKFQIGAEETKGLGAGANPEIGRISAEENKEDILKILEGSDMVFIAAGMGGGTGTGAAPVVAQLAKERGILTVAVVTKPFGFEGKKRMAFAEDGIAKLKEHVDSLIVIPNEKLMEVIPKNVPLIAAFAAANDVLHVAVKGVSDLITNPGMINVDFADIKTVMSSSGLAMMGLGKGKGEDRAILATKEAISSPLLDDVNISDASGLIVSISSGFDITLEELDLIGDEVAKLTEEDAVRVIGSTFNPDLNDEIHVSVIATGLKSKHEATAKEVDANPFIGAATTVAPKKQEPTNYDMPAFLRQPSK
ncbi:cell division protein FtsZ [Vibrio crassostreae]|uniref:cell division protein FtsZ n=1 Tax=Vibrio crassostreae TaxID=246167 RepID=UPI001B30F0AE|nr:cell division protein FtsZ [Vibrio crassostreae]